MATPDYVLIDVERAFAATRERAYMAHLEQMLHRIRNGDIFNTYTMRFTNWADALEMRERFCKNGFEVGITGLYIITIYLWNLELEESEEPQEPEPQESQDTSNICALISKFINRTNPVLEDVPHAISNIDCESDEDVL